MVEVPDKQCDLVMKGGITSGVVYPRAIRLATGGQVEFASLVTGRFGLAKASAAMAVAAARTGLKVLVEPAA